jgi:3-deoxy-D-manno-octulosonate 8-phosphate phosphatase (KDO 8-P phosphatase)
VPGQKTKSLAAVQASFESAGGHFVAPVDDVAAAVKNCRGIVFDWDGVFNPGRKGASTQSDFTEVDSMGTNMLRYGLWRNTGALPFAAIISGENNQTAIGFARREHFHAVFTGVRDKRQVIEQLSTEHGLDPKELICVFDDINDLGMAEMCGVRLMVRRDASPLLAEYAVEGGICDYFTGSAEYAVREICELLLGLLGSYAEVVQSRVAVDADYQRYFDSRQAVECQTR